MRKALSLLVLAGSLAGLAHAAVQTRDITYKEGKTELKGMLAWDDAVAGPRPGILVIHQWMGLTDYEKGRAKQLAGLGYTAFAADIYGAEDTPKDMKSAGASAGKYKGDRALYRKRLSAALAVLKKQAEVDPKRTAAIGYCFGGTGALEMARMNADVLGVVAFHGGLDAGKIEDVKEIKPKVLVLHGANDPYGPADVVNALEKELDAAHADWQVVKYSGAVHAFTQPEAGNDPSKGVAYNASADKRSWAAMQGFFNELFK
jgi:dienelactone hydrolase